MKKNILYITYDGILEPLGSSQVLSYVTKLSYKHNFVLLSFEKKDDLKNKEKIDQKTKYLKSLNIEWVKLKYHSNPKIISSIYDLFLGFLFSYFIIKRKDIHLIHSRSYLPSFISYLIFKILKTPYIFDMRGFWADEKIDGKTWKKNSLIYKITKKIEKKLIINAFHLILLTKSGVNELKKFDYYNKEILTTVISTCVDLDKFELIKRDKNYFNLNNKSRITIGYLGSVRLWYRFDFVVNFFLILLKLYPNSILNIINKDDHEYIKSFLITNNVPLDNIIIEKSEHDNIVKKIKKIDIGIFFLNPSFSKRASNPTKLGEFLASGIPCITNNGIGDVEFLIKDNNCGFLLENLNYKIDEKFVIKSINKIFNEKTHINCRYVAENYLSLTKAIKKIDFIYDKISVKY